MPTLTPKRGAKPSPRSALAAASPHVPVIGAPPTFLMKPARISMWGNDVHGDCVTAEEAFAKACNNPEIFISDAEVIEWAERHGVLEGANLGPVMTWMQTDGFPDGNFIFDDGPYVSVNWTDMPILQSAISSGPVKLGVAADQIETSWRAASGRTGWFGTGWHPDSNEDHCVSLCGYGPISWLAQQLGVQVPPGVNGAMPGLAMFTWNSIGIVDVPSMLAVTEEAWLRAPTTVARPHGGWMELYSDNDNLAMLDVARNGDGRLEVIGINSAGNIWRTAQSFPGQWGNFQWTELYSNNDNLKSLRVAQNGDGRLEVVGIAADGSIWRTAQSSPGQWARPGWSELYSGSDNLRTLRIAQNADWRLEVFGIAANGNIWRTAQSSPGEWVNVSWIELYTNADTLAMLDCDCNADGRLEVVGVNAAGNIWRTAQVAPGKW